MEDAAAIVVLVVVQAVAPGVETKILPPFICFHDDSVDVVPIEGTGRLNTTKGGSTIRILHQDLKG